MQSFNFFSLLAASDRIKKLFEAFLNVNPAFVVASFAFGEKHLFSFFFEKKGFCVRVVSSI